MEREKGKVSMCNAKSGARVRKRVEEGFEKGCDREEERGSLHE
jgi:hypothetical protein